MANSPKIYFFLEEVNYNLENKRKIKEWIIKAAENEEYRVGCLNFIFTSDNVLLQLNKEYLRHFSLTDIITFDLSEKDEEISGDVFISIDRAKENARIFKVSLAEEVHRLIIHGFLHLVGYKDKTEEDKVTMRAREEFYLSLPPML